MISLIIFIFPDIFLISRFSPGEQSNFRMANISNLKINELSNVERPNLRVTTIQIENWEDKASKFF